MPIRFKCPTCQASLTAGDGKAGSKLPCPKCGQRLQVPPPPVNHTILGELEPAAGFQP